MESLKHDIDSLMKSGINNNTYNLLFSDYDNLPKEEQGSYENFVAYATIDCFTKSQDKKILARLLKLFYKKALIDLNKISFNQETKQYEYQNNDLIITFDKFFNILEDKKLIKQLNSNKRYCECHSRAMGISQSIEGSKIVTCYITILNQKILSFLT